MFPRRTDPSISRLVSPRISKPRRLVVRRVADLPVVRLDCGFDKFWDILGMQFGNFHKNKYVDIDSLASQQKCRAVVASRITRRKPLVNRTRYYAIF